MFGFGPCVGIGLFLLLLIWGLLRLHLHVVNRGRVLIFSGCPYAGGGLMAVRALIISSV